MKSNPVVRLDYNFEDKQIFICSDLHWDNPHCKRDLLKKDFDEAVRRNADIVIIGDLFCAMQGAYDPRKMKEDVRPEHNNNRYLDSLVETCADWLEPYKNHIKMIGYGNHETAIIKRHETDLTQRLVTLLNYKGGNVQLGGYGGWIFVSFVRSGKTSVSYKIKYHHGFGGGGAVTKGVIQYNRIKTWVEGADMIVMGHVHEDHDLTYQVEYVTRNGNIEQKKITMLRTATYKEEYGDGTHGWHIMRGAPPKPLGGRFLHLMPKRTETDTWIETFTEPSVKN